MIHIPTARDSKDLVSAYNLDELIPYQIFGKIIEAVGDQKLHAEWYSCPVQDTDDGICYWNTVCRIVENVQDNLTASGYKCKMFKFRPSDLYKTYRVKLHINWEE